MCGPILWDSAAFTVDYGVSFNPWMAALFFKFSEKKKSLKETWQ